MATRCKVCDNLTFKFETITLSKYQYHKKCFKCSTCGCTLNLINANSQQGELFCSVHNNGNSQGHKKTSTESIAPPKPQKVRPPSAEMQAISGECHLLGLPDEMILLVANSVNNVKDLCSLAQTCVTLSSVIDEGSLWKSFISKYRFETTSTSDFKKEFKTRYEAATKVRVNFDNLPTQVVSIDPTKTAEELKPLLCKAFGIRYCKPFKLRYSDGTELVKDKLIEVSKILSGSNLHIATDPTEKKRKT